VTYKNHAKDQIHHPDCSVLSDIELGKKARVFSGLQSATEASSHLYFVTSMFRDDYSTKNVQVTNQINGQIRRGVMDGNDGVLPQGTPYAAPKAYTETLIRAG
jgi:hypothetical protein